MIKRLKLKRGKEELTSTGGNFVCGHFLRGIGLAFLPLNFQKRRSDAISDRDCLLTMTGMLCNGRTDFTDVGLYAEDCVFSESFGISQLPSEATLRQRLDDLPAQRSEASLREVNLSLLKTRNFGTVHAGHLDWVPVDIDVSPLDNSGSHKQGVSMTYKQHDGYAPILAYVGKEGYMLNHQLRPGKQHCQDQTPEFIAECIKDLDTLGFSGRCLLRLDSGNDAQENFAHFGDNFFIVKRNLRKECREQWLAMARRVGEQQPSREGKNVYTGFVSHLKPGGASSKMNEVPVAFEVIERLTDPDGNAFLLPQIEVNTFWTNLPCSADEVINLYHDHGTSEQFHSELKSDLNIEQLPSGKFCVNKIVMLCGMLAFNLLRTIGQEVIARAGRAPVKIKVTRWRIKTVLSNIVFCAVRVIRHARRIRLHFGKHCPWFDIIDDITRFAATA